VSLYLIIVILIFIFPLILSFESRVRFYRKFLPLLKAILLVGPIFILWDILAVTYGDWSFNPRYLAGITVGNLPIEEILFFVVVPYSCLFIYEVLDYLGVEQAVRISPKVLLALAMVLFLGAWVYRQQIYTFAALSAASLTLLIVLKARPALFQSRKYWLFLFVNSFPFIIVNGILTAVPVVNYNAGAIWGVRLGTIPLEDFFYCFSYLTLSVLVYLDAQRRRVN